jgi:hypothetical protein
MAKFGLLELGMGKVETVLKEKYGRSKKLATNEEYIGLAWFGDVWIDGVWSI